MGEKDTVATREKKVSFLENLSKLFPVADDIFDNRKIDIGDDLPEITIPNTQTMFKLFLGGADGGNELKFHALQNIGTLNESNGHFLDYLLSDFALEVLEDSLKYWKYLLQ